MNMGDIKFYKSTCYAKIFLLYFLLSKVANSGGDDDQFCKCNKNEIKCKGIQDIDMLSIHFSAVKETCSATKLRIYNSHLYALPHALLNGTHIKEMKIESTYLPFLAVTVEDENSFSGSLLEKISIEMVLYPYNWDWKLLNVCHNLTELRISKSDIFYIGKSFKKLKLPNLDNLVITKSRVKWIHDEAFAALEKLAFFNFKENKVRSFKRSLLPDPASYLTVFNFRSNELEFLEADFFNNMPLLTFVNLENNQLVTLSEFKNRVFFVLLAGNPLVCDCSLLWLNKAKNQTDYYRFSCFDPDSSGKYVPMRTVRWKEKDCKNA